MDPDGNRGPCATVRGSMRGRPSLCDLAAFLAVAMGLAACGPSPTAVPTQTASPSGGQPSVAIASKTPHSPPPTDSVGDAIAAPWRSQPFDARDDPRVSLVNATCNAAGHQIPVPLDLVDARGERRLVIVYATDATSAAFECFADIGATKASEVQLLQLQDAGTSPIADADIDIGHYGIVSFGKIQAIVLVGRVGVAGASVVADLADGTRVFATKRGGWYAMWWPGPTLAASVSSLNGSGGVIGTATPRL